MASMGDYQFMSRAVHLAERGLYTTDPNPRVGCVLVRDGEVVGEGWHERAGGPHAEVVALERAGALARGATAYVSLEPCCHHGRTPPCADALIEAGVVRVVGAMTDPNPQVAGQGFARLRDAGVEVEEGLLEQAAEALNPGFVMRMRRGRPWVRCKLAMSLDGRTAMASGESKWITGAAARQDVHRLRARSSAVVTGIGTVLADDPSLTVRLDDQPPGGGWRQPLRVVLDTSLQMPATARMLSLPGGTLVVTAQSDEAAAARLSKAGAEVVCLPGDREGVDLGALMRELGRRQVNEVLVESGATLSGALLAAGLVDELVIYLAPHIMGSGGRGLFDIPDLIRMDQRVELEVTDVRPVGSDWRIRATPKARR